MSEILLGDCDDCVDGICTMNCSSATPTTTTEHIAASIWAEVFPQKASAEQVRKFQVEKQIEAGGLLERILGALEATTDQLEMDAQLHDDEGRSNIANVSRGQIARNRDLLRRARASIAEGVEIGGSHGR